MLVEAEAAAPADERRTRTSTFVLSAAGLAVLLSVAFFPLYFNTILSYDDEGSFLTVVARFLHHGSLYAHTHGPYGPFYFSVLGLIFRVAGRDPTLTSARLVVLVFTALAAGMFAATVWRVTRNLLFALLAEITTYFVLVRVAGREPLHPGSMIVLLLSVLTYALVCYATLPSTASLVVVGAVLGALTMIKVNIGVLAVAAVVVAFVIGNERFPKPLRVTVAVAALLLPFLMTFQLLYQLDTFQLAVIVSLGLLVAYAALSVDTVDFPPRAFLPMAAAAATVTVLSCVWPLANGTSIGALFHGVVIQPLRQASNLQAPTPVQFEWVAMLLTACGAALVLARRDRGATERAESTWMFDAALGIAAVSVLVIGMFFGFGAWLPALALLPALAWLAVQPRSMRLALRFLIPLAVLQMLHAYPVVGSQAEWGSVILCVPCVIAMAAATSRLLAWQQAGATLRFASIGALIMVLAAAGGYWPVAVWHDYEQATPLDLPGARFVRVDAAQARDLQRLARVVRKRCDTFYSAPAIDSLYLYARRPLPTGLLANAPGALDAKEQREVARQLSDARSHGKRVCIVRNNKTIAYWYLSSYGQGPLGFALADYQREVARIHDYTVSVFGPSQLRR